MVYMVIQEACMHASIYIICIQQMAMETGSTPTPSSTANGNPSSNACSCIYSTVDSQLVSSITVNGNPAHFGTPDN